MNEETHVVYWIRHKNHTDIKTQGYVGVTNNFNRRMIKHSHDASTGSKYTVHRAIRKYGEDIIKSAVVCGDEEFCYFVEAELRPEAETGWNLAHGGLIPPLAGKSHSDETKYKMSLAQKGKIVGLETRKRMSAASKGRKHSEHTKAIIRQKATGRVKSEDSKRKYAESMTGRNLWENSAARKDLWAIADKFYELYLQSPKANNRTNANKLGFYDCNPWKMKAEFVKGWNPLEDPEWLAFKAKYEKEQHEQQT